MDIMAQSKNEQFRIRLSGIHVDLENKRVELEAAGKPFAEIDFSGFPETVVFQAPRDLPTLPLPALEAVASDEKEAGVTLTGRLKTKPRPGRPDSKGKPTAWARFAAHQVGEDEAHMYSASFHRHTAQIALELSAEDRLTVQGYPHPSEDPNRMDTFNVFNIIDYPGKEERQR